MPLSPWKLKCAGRFPKLSTLPMLKVTMQEKFNGNYHQIKKNTAQIVANKLGRSINMVVLVFYIYEVMFFVADEI